MASFCLAAAGSKACCSLLAGRCRAEEGPVWVALQADNANKSPTSSLPTGALLPSECQPKLTAFRERNELINCNLSVQVADREGVLYKRDINKKPSTNLESLQCFFLGGNEEVQALQIAAKS
jgi:hypothetical protein